MKPIDAHTHIWGGSEDANAALMLEGADLFGIERIVICPIRGGYYPEPDDIAQGNTAMIRIVRERPDVFIGCPTVDPRRPDEAKAEIDRALEAKACNIVKVWVSCRADSPQMAPTAEHCVARGLPLLIHSFYKRPANLQDESTAGHVAILGRRFPGLRILMAHMAMDWELGIKAVREVPNISMDFSGSIWQAGAVEKAVRELGVERILFGTDAPGVPFQPKLGQLWGLDVTEAQRELIARGNAIRLLNL